MRRHWQHLNYERLVWVVLCCLILTLLAHSVASASGDNTVTAKPDDSVVTRAFRKAIDADLSFGIDPARTQPAAIKAWEEVLKLEDASPEQKVFAAWRIGSLCAYNFDPVERKEKPDMEKADKYFRMARDLMPGTISVETMNATTQLSSLPGSPIERVRRFVEGYKWMQSRTPEMVAASAFRVSRHGYLIAEPLYTRSKAVPPVKTDENELVLKKMLKDGRQTVSDQIAGFLKYAPDGWERNALLDALRNTGDAQDLKEWREIRSEFESKWTFGKLDHLENHSGEASQDQAASGRLATDTPVSTGGDQRASSSQVSADRPSPPWWVITVVVCGIVGGAFVLAYWRLRGRGKASGPSMQERGAREREA